MIKRVFGKVNEKEVVFSHVKGNLYEVEFPLSTTSGKYIVEVYAEDWAGNISYACTLLCTVDPKGVCIHVRQLNYWLKLITDGICIRSKMVETQLLCVLPPKCEGRQMVKFIQGEDRYVKFEVHSAEEQVIIESARYSLSIHGIEEKEGNCDILSDDDGKTIIRVKINPSEKGYYELEITYCIADETLKHIEKIQVI